MQIPSAEVAAIPMIVRTKELFVFTTKGEGRLGPPCCSHVVDVFVVRGGGGGLLVYPVERK